ncbi:SDR family oxidoreductase [Cupriavidus necator]|uniref:SDR family NAD(P)-dependent oxidoreductase n=1 Tax=Cupriavidus necator TaxID=106590 RepID=UPI00339D64D7
MSTSWLKLEDKVCVVTGGAGGIGRAIVSAFAQAGAKVAILDRDSTVVEQFAKEVGHGAIGVACDVASEGSVNDARQAVIKAFGRCDVLVNNAAIIKPQPLLDSTQADWERNLAINLTGYYLCARIFGKEMIAAGGGAIVHVGSIAAELPQPNGLDYTACKGAIVALSRQIAVEWGAKGIRSNVVNPGMIRTPMTTKLNADPEVVAKREALTAIKRLGTPDDIANVVAFLASERSGYVTGADLMATGGLHVMMMNMIPQPGLKPAQGTGDTK